MNIASEIHKTCLSCNGSGSFEYPSLLENSRMVIGTCDICMGRGYISLPVDVLETHLLSAMSKIASLNEELFHTKESLKALTGQNVRIANLDDRLPHRVDPSDAPRITPEFLPASRVDPADVPVITQEHINEALKPFESEPTFVQRWLATHHQDPQASSFGWVAPRKGLRIS